MHIVMISKRLLRGFVIFGLLFSSLVVADEFTVLQKDKTFKPGKLKIKVGDTVNFMNDDKIFHNVFSLSEYKSFDLGSYPKGQSRKVVFDKPGTIEIECSIHPEMLMTIEVTK